MALSIGSIRNRDFVFRVVAERSLGLTAAFVFGLVLFAAPMRGSAASFFLWNGGNGNWTDTNWCVLGGACGAAVPSPSDSAAIGNGTVGLFGSAGISFLDLDHGGTLNVANATGMLSDSNQMVVGFDSTGILNISNGGTVTAACSPCSPAVLGQNPGSFGQVTVSGQSFLNVAGPTGQLDIGYKGQGILQINQGATVTDTCNSSSCSAAVIAYQLGSIGGVTVNGGTWNNNGTGILNVGAGGNGSLLIENGGLVTDTVSGVAGNSGSRGSVTVDGATWTSSGLLQIGNNNSDTIAFVGLLDNARLNSGQLVIGQNGILSGDPSTIDVNGDFTLDAGGMLSLAIAGTDPGSMDQLNITGNAVFDGVLQFDFIDGFAPKAGDMFGLINDLNGVDLSGATIKIAGLEPGFEYSTAFSDGVLTLTALSDGVSTAPEPESASLLMVALAALGLVTASKQGRRLLMRARWGV